MDRRWLRGVVIPVLFLYQSCLPWIVSTSKKVDETQLQSQSTSEKQLQIEGEMTLVISNKPQEEVGLESAKKRAVDFSIFEQRLMSMQEEPKIVKGKPEQTEFGLLLAKLSGTLLYGEKADAGFDQSNYYL